MKSWSEWFVVLRLSRIRIAECHLLEIAAKKSEKNHLEQRTFQIKNQPKFKYHLCVTILLSSINYYFFRIPVLEGNIWFSKGTITRPRTHFAKKTPLSISLSSRIVRLTISRISTININGMINIKLRRSSRKLRIETTTALLRKQLKEKCISVFGLKRLH